MAGYVTTLQAFVCVKLPAQEASTFCEFWKLISCDFTPFFSFWLKQTFVCLDVRNKELICVHIHVWLILIRWILVSVGLKKW